MAVRGAEGWWLVDVPEQMFNMNCQFLRSFLLIFFIPSAFFFSFVQYQVILYSLLLLIHTALFMLFFLLIL